MSRRRRAPKLEYVPMGKFDVCIIGGGAAGLAAAASLDEKLDTCILEKNEIPGKKIMATGGGRCNITNRGCAGCGLTLDFFRSMGLETYCDSEGRYYPYSNRAGDVVKTLTEAIEKKGVELITSAPVSSVERDGEGFHVMYGKGKSVTADNVILSMGGKAAPQFGTTGDGYAIAGAFGHSVKRLYPILTPVECGEMKALKGIRAKGTVRLYRDGLPVCEDTGEIQFTRDGISGICVFNVTPYIKADEDETLGEALKRFTVELDLAPDFTDEQIGKRESTFGILSERLSEAVGTNEIKHWRLPVTGVKGWKNAQCTAGGVALDEIDMTTMESKLEAGLYFAGEIIDAQYPCGGFNLQNAWETGMRAAKAINGR